jgi:hypothetical protein
MRRIIYILLIVFAGHYSLNGQGVLLDQPKMLFNNDRTVAAFLNSNGIGFDYRYAQYLDVRNDRIYEVSFDYLKHPKEYKSVVAYDVYTRRFVYGKENYFWEIKGQIGNQHELYKKYDFSSISIRLFYQGGLTLGFQKPIYYEIITFDSSGQITSSEEKKFDPSIHHYNYGGTASFFKGFDELKLIPGITINTGISFEYSEREPSIHALEAGIGFSLYPRNIQIMASDETKLFFFNMFVGYRFGNMIDISDTAAAKSKKERRRERKEAMQQPPQRMQ